MPGRRTLLIAVSLLALLTVALVPGDAPGQARASAQTLLTPAAPPPGDLPFDIPVYPWYLEQVIAGKAEFVQVLAGETVSLGEAGVGGDVQAIVQGALGLSGVADRINAVMVSMGETDPSFGIADVSQLLPLEGAVRDTIFGFVVWHESSVAGSRKTAAELELLVNRLRSHGTAAVAHANALAARSGASKDAVSRADYEPVANTWADLDKSMTDLKAVADAAEADAAALGALATSIRANAARGIDADWASVIAATGDAGRLAHAIRGSLDALLASNAVFADLTGALKSFAGSLDGLRAVQGHAGDMAYVPWTALKDDVDDVLWLRERVLSDTAGVYPEETKARVRAALGSVVRANRLLAERAVEYGSTVVAGAMDELEARSLRLEGYSDAASARRREDAMEKAAARVAENAEMQAALISAREARAALAAGTERQAEGRGSEHDALVHFKNAWIHALNAGASAGRALGSSGAK